MQTTQQPPSHLNPAGLRPGLLIPVVFLVLLALGSAYMLYYARQDRNAQLQRLQQDASALSALLDREVGVSRALLAGLASSPLIAAGDLAGFHQQMLDVERPEGVALVLSDKERQLANVLRPYGAPLPELSAFTPQPDFFERLETDGIHISSRVRSALNGAFSTVISMKIPGPDGKLKYILSIALAEGRLNEILNKEINSTAEGYLVIDAMGQEIARRELQGISLSPASLALNVALPASSMVAKTGVFSRTGAEGDTAFTAYARSSFTGWTTSVSLPAAVIEQRLRAAYLQLGLASLLVAMLITGLLLYWRARVERPFRSMGDALEETRTQLTQLNQDMGTLRQSEHRRIAQELHDTTAQRLVAANLHLSALRHADPRDMQAVLTAIAEIRQLIEQSLKELRSFSFLLHPPELQEQPFDRVMAQLFHSFASRATLGVRTDIDPAAADLPQACKEAFHRVAQEALLNIHRHAGARNITCSLLPAAAEGPTIRWALRIVDDGSGGISFPSPGVPMGLGLAGIADVLRKLGGSLTILDLGTGTEFSAVLPVTLHQSRSGGG